MTDAEEVVWRETGFSLDGSATWTVSSGTLRSSRGTRVPLARIVEIRLTEPGGRCLIQPDQGRPISLRAGQTPYFETFLDTLIARVRAVRPDLRLMRGVPRAERILGLIVSLGICGLAIGVLIATRDHADTATGDEVRMALRYAMAAVLLGGAYGVWRAARLPARRPMER